MSADRVLSCALLATSPSGWLLAHATRTPRWDLPKGKLEAGEPPWKQLFGKPRRKRGWTCGATKPRSRTWGATLTCRARTCICSAWTCPKPWT